MRRGSIIEATIPPITRVERVPILEANARVLAHEVTSDRDVPPFSRAAMDGYAVVAENTFGASRFDPKTLRVIDKVYTGQMPAKARRTRAKPWRSPPARRCPRAPTRW